jgi:UDP-N-acetylmuramoyl-tripeptide--D-alanyl-D-alanine ligase
MLFGSLVKEDCNSKNMQKAAFNIDELLNATGGNLVESKSALDFFKISTDSRTIKSGDFYLPLVGGNFDGHDYINSAVEKGCIGYFIDKENFKHFNSYKNAEFVIVVDDTTQAYLKTASYYRKKINPKVVAITGSSGKTTTKEFVYSVLKQKYRTVKSKLNHNNEIGLCQTILSMDETTEYLVLEMGMRGLGEIELLSECAAPDIAIITNIGPAHIGRLGSMENIARAKCEIIKFLNPNGLLISYNSDFIKNEFERNGRSIFYDSKSINILNSTPLGSTFEYKNNTYTINEAGEYNILNSIAAIETGIEGELSYEQIQKGLLEFENVGQRNEIIALENGAIIINDCYNANPDSVIASIKAVSETYKDKSIFLVIGDMLELGEFEEQYHKEVGRFINNTEINDIITVGELALFTAKEITNGKNVSSFKNTDEASCYLAKHLNDNAVVLLKASRGMAFEQIIECLKGK